MANYGCICRVQALLSLESGAGCVVRAENGSSWLLVDILSCRFMVHAPDQLLENDKIKIDLIDNVRLLLVNRCCASTVAPVQVLFCFLSSLTCLSAHAIAPSHLALR